MKTKLLRFTSINILISILTINLGFAMNIQDKKKAVIKILQKRESRTKFTLTQPTAYGNLSLDISDPKHILKSTKKYTAGDVEDAKKMLKTAKKC